MKGNELPILKHYHPDQVEEVWRVPYQQRAAEAEAWARQHKIEPSIRDRFRMCLLSVDVQNTFCIPGFELYVGSRSGTGAVDDNRRLWEFIYRHLGMITEICPTRDMTNPRSLYHTQN